MSSSGPEAVEPAPPRTGPGAHFRPDVEGLRAVAIVSVLLAHARLSFARGGYVGVDVFFVISGFLITSLLLRELDRTGHISLTRFYARRIRRLMPQAVTALAAVTVLSAWLLPATQRPDVGRDVMAAGVYSINWRFSAETMDYFGRAIHDSPLAHFWSLAVEEQFYLTWPLLLLALTWLTRRHGGDRHRTLAISLGLIGIGSFIYALHASSTAPDQAYFSTPARVWELALGGLVAVALGGHRLHPVAAAAAAWTGIAAIVVSVCMLDEGARFPGPWALLPTLGAAALVIAGSSRRSALPVRALAVRPMQHLGRLSYAWYVWHWPALVFAAAVLGPLAPGTAVLVIAASFVPTFVTNRWIEEPIRKAPGLQRRPRATLSFAPAGIACALVLGVGLLATVPTMPTLAASKAPGALQLDNGAALQQSARALRPSPMHATSDVPKVWSDGCAVRFLQTSSPGCVYGHKRSQTTVVLFGDSHANQYFTAFEKLARNRNWRLVSLSKAGCTPAEVHIMSATLRRRYGECDIWRERSLRRIEQVEHPAMVVTSSATYYKVVQASHTLDPAASKRALAAGYAATVRRLQGATSHIVVIHDAPRPPIDIPSCVAGSMHHLRHCAFPAHGALDSPDVIDQAIRSVAGIRVLDPISRFCLPSGLCPAVIGNVIVYRNDGHITATYISTMAKWIGQKLPRLHRTPKPVSPRPATTRWSAHARAH